MLLHLLVDKGVGNVRSSVVFQVDYSAPTLLTPLSHETIRSVPGESSEISPTQGLGYSSESGSSLSHLSRINSEFLLYSR